MPSENLQGDEDLFERIPGYLAHQTHAHWKTAGPATSVESASHVLPLSRQGAGKGSLGKGMQVLRAACFHVDGLRD
jgi:hypothetical protein